MGGLVEDKEEKPEFECVGEVGVWAVFGKGRPAYFFAEYMSILVTTPVDAAEDLDLFLNASGRRSNEPAFAKTEPTSSSSS